MAGGIDALKGDMGCPTAVTPVQEAVATQPLTEQDKEAKDQAIFFVAACDALGPMAQPFSSIAATIVALQRNN